MINWRLVRELFRRTAPSISRLTLDGPDGKRERLSVTGEHPFFVEGKCGVYVLFLHTVGANLHYALAAGGYGLTI